MPDDDAELPRAPSIADESQFCPDCGRSLWVLARKAEEPETAPRILFCGVCNRRFTAQAIERKPEKPESNDC